MANSVGRPKSDIETRMIALRVPVDLFNRLARHVDLTTSRSRGAKASMNSVGNYALEYFLDAQEHRQEPPPQESPQPSPPARQAAVQSPTRKFILKNQLHREIIQLLQQYPDGLSHASIKEKLNLEKDLGDTLQGMLRAGKIRTSRKGIYVAAEGVEIP